MKFKLLITILCAFILNFNAFCQTSDYCFKTLPGQTLKEACCFDMVIPVKMGKTVAEIFSPNYKDIEFFDSESLEWITVSNSYHIQEFEKQFKGIKRVTIVFNDNLKLIFATTPYYNNDYAKAEVESIIVTEGEAQLLSQGTFQKVKENVGSNISLYKVVVSTKPITYNNKTVNSEMILYFEDGMTLRRFEFNGKKYRIPY